MLAKIWEQFLAIVREEAGSRVVETWLKAVSLYQWDALEKKVFLLAPNSFVKEWIKSNYMALFGTHLSRLLHVDELKIVFVDAEASDAQEEHRTTIIPAHRVSEGPSTALSLKNNQKNRYHVNKNYRFDTFIKGPNNQMAYAAALAITKKLGKLYNPLFIYGGSGLGKTHLLHAIANEVKRQSEDIQVLYQPAERFVNEFINAIRFDKVHAFQAKYKNIDVFLVDDIQSISNKEQTQEAFFHIFNAMHDAHKQIVFSSDAYPADIDGLAERLRSRLEWGLVADIQVPTLETKIAILKRKAELNNYELPDDVALFVASRVVSNVRELEGALIRIVAFASLTKQHLTLELAKKVLTRTESSKEIVIDFDRIVNLIQSHYTYTLSDLRSRNRSKQLSLARQIAMYCMKKYTSKSLHEIAYYLNRQDHSTVIHAYRHIEKKIKEDELFCQKLHKLEQEVRS
ncbi:MAG: chromosomal replication initiator protein DnaA [Candidatus Babeliales bacterium]